jgi:hypothetical protein
MTICTCPGVRSFQPLPRPSNLITNFGVAVSPSRPQVRSPITRLLTSMPQSSAGPRILSATMTRRLHWCRTITQQPPVPRLPIQPLRLVVPRPTHGTNWLPASPTSWPCPRATTLRTPTRRLPPRAAPADCVISLPVLPMPRLAQLLSTLYRYPPPPHLGPTQMRSPQFLPLEAPAARAPCSSRAYVVCAPRRSTSVS